MSTSKRGRIGLILGILIAGAGVAGTIVLRSNSSSSGSNGATVTVVVASQDIPAGTQITSSMLRTESLSASFGAISDPSQAVGEYAISEISPGTLILPADITAIGGSVTQPTTGGDTSNGTAATTVAPAEFALKAGDVAIAMPVTPQSAVGYYVQAGDRIDFIMNLGGQAGLKYGFQDVLVLRVGGQLAGEASGGVSSRQDGLIIVELPRRQAEELSGILAGSGAAHIQTLVLRSRAQYGKGYLDSGADDPAPQSPTDSAVTPALLNSLFR